MPICLLTDFGLQDGYAGILKGVIAGIAPEAEVVDLSHEIEAFNLIQAGFVLYQSYRYFPKGTIFVTVVDPGVGSERKSILIKTKDYYFIGPDNGIFSLVLSEENAEKIIHLQNPNYFLNQVSSVFHGRDLFAPVAAHLFQGVSLTSFGPKIEEYQRLDEFFPHCLGKKIGGRILSIDRFGNIITNVSKSFLEKNIPTLRFSVSINGKKIQKIYSHYAEGKKGEFFVLFGSSRFLEIAMNQKSAAKFLQAQEGESLSIRKI